MNEAMKDAWLEISQMLGEPTREELDVFLRTWQRAKQAYSAPVQSCYCPNCEAMGKELAALKAQPAPAPGYCKHCKQYSIEEPLPAAQRQWVGLEREIAAAVLDHCYGHGGVSDDMIERTTEVIKTKLKELNT
jgi:hypothetical protein